MEIEDKTLICDWGSSRLRAYLIDPKGHVLKNHESDRGIKAITGGESAFAAELNSVLNGLDLPSDLPIRISGMAGSKNGWIETDYLPTPAGPGEIAANFTPLPGYPDARLFGGLKHEGADGAVDVMRGEELQILGVLDLHPDAQQICLPGTHSKWATVEDGKITGFKTYMTGDLFSSLSERSIFAEQIANREFNREGFLHGCGLAREGNDLDDLFRLRTEFVFGKVSEEQFHSCLSGFLIANEIKAAGAEGTIHLCGSPSLLESYALALAEASLQSISIDSETATIRGHQSIRHP